MCFALNKTGVSGNGLARSFPTDTKSMRPNSPPLTSKANRRARGLGRDLFRAKPPTKGGEAGETSSLAAILEEKGVFPKPVSLIRPGLR
jgi:hypothetical protein